MLEHLIDRVQRDSVVAASDGRQVERQLDLPVLSGKADAVVRDHKLQRPVFGAADGDPDSPRPLLWLDAVSDRVFHQHLKRELRNKAGKQRLVRDGHLIGYLAYMHGQIEELVTNYGKIDILWFDYAYDELRGEAWKATELIRMVRRHQPDVIIDNRLETSGEGFGSLVTEQPAYYSGDFVSPEQILPPEGIRNVRGERVPWELCTTMNNNWGYNPYDTDYKPASMLIRKLVECVSKGGNMILNVGPDANGRFNAESCRLLDEIGAWMSVNSESIYGCGSADVPKPDWGWYTKKSGRIYAHILENPIGPLALTGLDAKRVGAVRRLADGSEVLRGESWITNAYENLAFVTLGTIPHFTYLLPDTTDTVLAIEYKEDPQ